jgi:hypothetical protein
MSRWTMRTSLLSLLVALSGTVAQTTCKTGSKPYSFETSFPGGKFDDNFMIEGLPENVIPGAGGSGIILKLSHPNCALTGASLCVH